MANKGRRGGVVMSITLRINYKEKLKVYEVECYSCGDTEEYEVEDWSDLIRTLKEDGWEIRHVDGEWGHYCLYCA